MSQWIDHKRKFYRDIVRHAPESLEGMRQQLGMDWGVPDRYLTRWWRKFHESQSPQGMSESGRLINHYMQGADPEFMLLYENSDEIRHAGAFGLKAGRAFGADNNNRLVEIRPAPSKSQLEVLGSIHDTLRWMYILTPEVQTYRWVCGVFLQGDGLGGHVHVGRRTKKLRNVEVTALDNVMRVVEILHLFNNAEITRRRQGDQFHQLYGTYGDVREQPYGYEYRTYPSWLDSPWMAFFHLVLTKIAVYDPEIINPGSTCPTEHVKNVLKYYSGLDDDARLALWALKRWGFPVHQGGDFKGRWGLGGYAKLPELGQTLIPDSIPATKDTLAELHGHLAEGRGIKTGVVPKETLPVVPNDLRALLDTVDTHGVHQKGVGEMCWDLVGMRKMGAMNIWVGGGRAKDRLMFGSLMLQYMPKNWAEVAQGKAAVGEFPFGFEVGSNFNPNKIRKILLSGAFPIWSVKDADDGTAEKWMKGLGEASSVKKLIGREESY